MKKFLIVFLLVCMLPCTSYALDVKIEGVRIGETVYWTFDGGSKSGFAGLIDTSIGDLFCAEVNQNVYLGSTYTYTPVTPYGAYISAAWLVDQFGASADTNIEAAALQAAIWEVIHGGSFYLTGSAAVQAQQQSYLDALPETPTLPAGYVILVNQNYQDLLITRVPEPMTALLLGLGLVGLAGLRRKK